MINEIFFNSLSREDEQAVAKYEGLLSKHETRYKHFAIRDVIAEYIPLSNIPITNLSDEQWAQKYASLNRIEATPTGRLHNLRDALVVEYYEEADLDSKGILKETICWLIHYISTVESEPVKSGNLYNIYDSGNMIYDLLKEYINDERSRIRLEAFSPMEEMELDRDIQYEKESAQREGYGGSELVEETVLNVLAGHHEEFLEWAISWDVFYNGFERYASQKTKEAA